MGSSTVLGDFDGPLSKFRLRPRPNKGDSPPNPDASPGANADVPRPATFTARVVASELVDEAVLSGYEKAHAGDAGRMARALVRDGLLTVPQAESLLPSAPVRPPIAGRYEVLARLGSGSQGDVYLCRHVVMRRRVTVKVLTAHAAEDPRAGKRLAREAQVAATLDHPNISLALDFGFDGGNPYLVYEFVDGVSSEELVRREGPLDPRRAAGFALQAAHGLAYAHGKGVVHRDVKPANLLVTRSGQVKVLDFGLAHSAGRDGDAAGKDRWARTAEYAAPEVFHRPNRADRRSDLYSLGATLYFLLTGRPPYPGVTPRGILLGCTHARPVPLTAFRSDIPADRVAFVDRLLATDPATRPATAAEVETALAAWCGDDVTPDAPAHPTTTETAAHQLDPTRETTALPAETADPGATVNLPRSEVPGCDYGPIPAPPPAVTVAEASADGRPAGLDALAGVLDRLRTLNPGYDGGVRDLVVSDGRVVLLALPSEMLADLRPLTRLTALQELKLRPRPGARPTCPLDLRPLAALNLRRLKCDRSWIDPAGLTGLTVSSLSLCDCGLTDLTRLAGLSLTSLSLTGNRDVTDLSPLDGMPLTTLRIGRTGVSDLSPVRTLPLRVLDCSGTRVRDLTPLLGLRLDAVDLRGLGDADLTPLAALPLREVWCDYVPDRHRKLFRGIRTLRTLNGRPVTSVLAKTGGESGT